MRRQDRKHRSTVYPLDTRAETTGDLIAAVERNRSLLDSGQPLRILGGALRSPITTDARLLCQGLNYRDHAAEAGGITNEDKISYS